MTRSPRCIFGPPAPWLARSVCALLVAACGGAAGPTDGSNSGGDVTASYAVAFASGAQSGTLSLTTHTSGQAAGTMATVGGVTAALSGTYSASSGAFTVNGGGYAFTGSTSASSASGSFTGPGGGAGSFSGLPLSTGVTATSYCGSWQDGIEFGWLNVVVGGASVSSVAGGPFVGTVGLTGTLTASTLDASSSGGPGTVTIHGTLVTGDSISGTIVDPSGSGGFGAAKAACTAAASSGSTTPTTLSGEWATAQGTGTTITVALLQVGTGLSGTGVITVQPGIPASVGGGPPWTGDGYSLTSGSVSGTTVTFASTLVGKNARAAGGFYYGALSFAGTVSSGTAMTGTLTYTPTFTDSQVFTEQTAMVTLTRQ
ncbi:MAG TPA: hypothetical protein VMV51_05665 [Gemmatimonadaceae bacterium]|nr:hypothetical protein [Gemmatimonadaceae bacterium]